MQFNLFFETGKDLSTSLSPALAGDFDIAPLTKLVGKKDTTLMELLEAEINESNFLMLKMAPDVLFQLFVFCAFPLRECFTQI